MPVPSADTATFDAHGGVPTASFVPGGSAPRSGFDEELRRLLRSRLILVHLLALGFFFLLGTLGIVVPRQEGSSPLSGNSGFPWWLPALLAESVIGAVVLWRRQGMSLRSLRLWELIFFFPARRNRRLRPVRGGGRYQRDASD